MTWLQFSILIVVVVVSAGVVGPLCAPLYVLAITRLDGWLRNKRMQAQIRAEQRAAAKKAKERAQYTQPTTRSSRTHSLRTRRELAKRSRQEHRDKIASLKKLKQRRNRGHIPLHVRVAPKGWRREEAA